MFKTTALIVALGATPALAPTLVSADPTPAPVTYQSEEGEWESASGMVTNIDMDDDTFTIEMSDGELKQITYGDKTVFMFDGDASSAEDALQHNKLVRIEHVDGLAKLVVIANDESEEDYERAWGTVTNIDEDDHTFTIETADGDANQVTWGEDTVFLKDNEVCPFDDALEYDTDVRVLHREGLASYVISMDRDH